VVLAGNEFRRYGPVLRFDAHLEPPRANTPLMQWYAASTPDAGPRRAFQGDRTIDRVRERPYLTGLAFTRTVRLLNLAVESTGAWATEPAEHSQYQPRHMPSQGYARAIVEAFPALDGCGRTAVSPATRARPF
jgi:hypothetical protein